VLVAPAGLTVQLTVSRSHALTSSNTATGTLQRRVACLDAVYIAERCSTSLRACAMPALEPAVAIACEPVAPNLSPRPLDL
jgi:hypothetical protein